MNLVHAERLSNDKRVLAFARRVNTLFLKQGKTDIDFVHSEHEAVYMDDGGTIASIIVFERQDFPKRQQIYYWLPIVYTATRYRGTGCYPQLIEWLKAYAKEKGASSLSLEAKADNERMIAISDRHWEREYVRFTMKL